MDENQSDVRRLTNALAKSIPVYYCDRHVGERIAIRRRERDLQPSDLVFPGCRFTSTEKIEKTRNRPSARTILALALILQVEPYWLAWGKGRKELGKRSEESLLRFLGFNEQEMNTFYRELQGLRKAERNR